MNYLNDVTNAAFYSAGVIPQTVSSATTGAAIDCINAQGLITLLTQCGTLTGTFSFQVAECATSSGTFTAISGAAVNYASTDDSLAKAVTFTRTQRYLKVTATPQSSTSTVASAIVLSNLVQFN